MFPLLYWLMAQQLLVAGFVLWGLSLSLAFSLITLVLLRLIKGAFIGYLWAKDEQDRGA